jgi:hypothetical protein
LGPLKSRASSQELPFWRRLRGRLEHAVEPLAEERCRPRVQAAVDIEHATVRRASRLAKPGLHPWTRRLPNVAAARPAGLPGTGTPGRPATRPRRPRARSTPHNQPRTPTPPRPQGATAGVSTSLERSFRRVAWLCILSNTSLSRRRGVGPHCSFCGTFTGPFSQVEGLCTVLICMPCLEVRQAQPNTLLGLHDLAGPGSSGAARSTAAASGSSAPGTWRGTPQPSIPAGRLPTSCCGPTRSSACGSCTAGSPEAGRVSKITVGP